MLSVSVLLMALGAGLTAGKPAQPSDYAGDTLKAIKECQNEQSDIYFLLDASSSLMPRDFETVRSFVVSFVDKLPIAPNATRIGLGVFSDDFSGQFDLGEHGNKSSVVNAIREVPYYGGGTYTGKGLQGMRTTGFRDGKVRRNATKIGVVVTDGRSRHRTKTIAEAAQLKDEGVWLFAIGVGKDVDEEELAIFASEPHTEFLRHAATFDDLSGLTNELVFGACRLQPPNADNATCGRQNKADILFVYNAAGMNPARVRQVQTLTENVIQAFSMTSGNVRVGVISEGRQGKDIALSEYIRKEDLVRALKHQPSSELADLLRKTRQHGFEQSFGGRSNSKKLAIVFVDDIDVSIDALVEARMMTYDNVVVYVVEVGLAGDRSRVQALRTSNSDFYEFPKYRDMLDSTKQEDFINKLCEYL